MNLLIAGLLLLIFLLPAFAQTGRDPMGPATMGHQTYPNSGPLRKRSNDMTGKDMSNATLMGSDVDPKVPTRTPPMREKQEQKEAIKTGPYENGVYQFKDDQL